MAQDFIGGISKNNPLGDGCLRDPLGTRAAVREYENRAAKARTYAEVIFGLSKADTARDAHRSIPRDFWVDEEFQACVVSTLIEGAKAREDLEVISRVFGGKAR